ncbi:MAG TPA: TIM barrel protein [Herpetosiphonaceae bacterium]
MLLASLPPTVTVAVEQGWSWGMMIGLGAMVRSLRDSRRSQGMERQRLTGVGSAMGAELPPAIQRVSSSATDFDPSLQSGWWRTLRRTDGFSGTATREEALQVVMEVNQPNCVIAWDLAHDWLGGAKGRVADWRSTPASDFLDRVGYVRLHDVDAKGCDHWPLVVGNVPYTSQLRALLRHGFAGTVCLAIRYTQEMVVFGDRWQVLERSLAVTRQVLRLN